MKIKKGDRVVVLQGKDRGKEGVVSKVMPRDGKVLVDGINIVKKHAKQRSATQLGGIIDKDMPLPACVVAVISPKDGKATRVGYKIDAAGNKVRVCRRTGVEL